MNIAEHRLVIQRSAEEIQRAADGHVQFSIAQFPDIRDIIVLRDASRVGYRNLSPFSQEFYQLPLDARGLPLHIRGVNQELVTVLRQLIQKFWPHPFSGKFLPAGSVTT